MTAVSEEVLAALRDGRPVVALESTVLAHGLPFPRSLEVAEALETCIGSGGAVPATVAVLGGVARIGLDADERERVCRGAGFAKLSTRELPVAAARGANGATTVAATMWISSREGIHVFATGGIGGVHRGRVPDSSADLTELGRTGQVVVCAGPKAILDLQATREALETRGVLVVGWGTDEMPAFYCAGSGLPVDARVDSAEEVAALWEAHQAMDVPGAILLCVPPPRESALAREVVEGHVLTALESAAEAGISGKDVTPYLLAEMSRLSSGETLASNTALLLGNARVAVAVAREIARR